MTDPARMIPVEEAERIARAVVGATVGGGDTTVEIESWWNGELRWARNQVRLASDRRDIRITATRFTNGGFGIATTNQTDEISLKSIVRAAERGTLLSASRAFPRMPLVPPVLDSPKTAIWSDATDHVTAVERGRLARLLSDSARTQNFLSAGYIEMRAGEAAVFDTSLAKPDEIRYSMYTQAQCSTTVRHPKGIGSGWAGLSSYDWSAIDAAALGRVALDKCTASLNPVAIEPGRYVVILEPQAVADLFEYVFGWLNLRRAAELGNGPFFLMHDSSLGINLSKLGLQVVDSRITVSHDPADPILGVVPSPGLRPVTWIKNGVLTSLGYDRNYALDKLVENLGDDRRPSYRMSGGTTSIETMIQTTKRGLLITRFSNFMLLDNPSVLLSGVTRDGLMLIENGKITKSVKNLRITESPMFVLNQIEQLGPPVPVFRPFANPYSAGVRPAVVPALKVNDFSFTATSDAV